MHQYPAPRVVLRAAHCSNVTLAELANRPTIIPFIGKLRRVVQHQGESITGCESLARGLEVTGQDIPLIHSLVRQEAICGLGICPVLTGHWDTVAGPIRQLLKQRPKSPAQTLIHESALLNLLVDPTAWRLSESNSAPPAPRAFPFRHAAPCVDLTRNACMSHVRIKNKIVRQHSIFEG